METDITTEELANRLAVHANRIASYSMTKGVHYFDKTVEDMNLVIAHLTRVAEQEATPAAKDKEVLTFLDAIMRDRITRQYWSETAVTKLVRVRAHIAERLAELNPKPEKRSKP